MKYYPSGQLYLYFMVRSLRLNVHTEDVGKVKIAQMERNGDISVIMEEEN